MTALESNRAHTRVGDPAELMAVGNVFGLARSATFEDLLVVGSLRSNVDHLEGTKRTSWHVQGRGRI